MTFARLICHVSSTGDGFVENLLVKSGRGGGGVLLYSAIGTISDTRIGVRVRVQPIKLGPTPRVLIFQ